VTNFPELIKAASISDDEQRVVTEWITSQGLVKNLSMQGWVPHFFKHVYGVADEITIEPVRGIEASAVAVLVDGYGKLEGPKPSFLDSSDTFKHWSMDVSFSTFGAPNASYNMPWLNSGCDALVSHRIGSGHGMDASNVSRQGIVTRQDGASGDVRISPISAEDVLRAFLHGRGMEYVATSSPGLALNRIVEMINGFDNCKMFQNSAIRQTLDELANGDYRLASEVRGRVIRSLMA
jgi:hypothetical protein